MNTKKQNQETNATEREHKTCILTVKARRETEEKDALEYRFESSEEALEFARHLSDNSPFGAVYTINFEG